MIQYNVWFSFARDVDEASQLERIRFLLADFRSRDMVAEYCILRNRGAGDKTNMPPYQAIIEFRDDVQFALPFAEVAHIGVHGGPHGAMIEHVVDFVVEVFEQI